MEFIAPFWDMLFRRCSVRSQVNLLLVCQRVYTIGMIDTNLMHRILLFKRYKQLKFHPKQTRENSVEIVRACAEGANYVLSEYLTPQMYLEIVQKWGSNLFFVPDEKKTRLGRHKNWWWNAIVIHST
uniref:Uncharacterized protein n=1 Tax=viral metagenome TaxID=1070528 RepID=A0A6C0BP07_9ZZZZ